jgi:prepilin-type processing-associated H-X9-DG protein
VKSLEVSGYMLPILETSAEAKERYERGSRGFGSSHKSGLNAAFGDGSVRTISYSIAVEPWVAMCGRNDGLVVNFD